MKCYISVAFKHQDYVLYNYLVMTQNKTCTPLFYFLIYLVSQTRSLLSAIYTSGDEMDKVKDNS